MVTGANSALWSYSWKAFLPMWERSTSCMIATIGTPAFKASAKGATASVAAGPFWQIMTGTRPETRKRCKVLDAPDVILLRLLSEMPRGHIVDQALAKRTDTHTQLLLNMRLTDASFSIGAFGLR